MNWTSILIVIGVLALFLLFKKIGQVSAKDAQQYLKEGALVVDVRTAAEFNSGHLPDAIHIPLNQIETGVPRRVKDKNKVLLLHCQSGIRSGAAKQKLKGMGYAQVFNLGSYGRAAQILKRR